MLEAKEEAEQIRHKTVRAAQAARRNSLDVEAARHAAELGQIMEEQLLEREAAAREREAQAAAHAREVEEARAAAKRHAADAEEARSELVDVREELEILRRKYDDALEALTQSDLEEATKRAELEGLKQSLRARDENLREQVRALAAEVLANG